MQHMFFSLSLARTFLIIVQEKGVTSKYLFSCFLERNDAKYSLALAIQNPVQTHFIESCITITFVQDFLQLTLSPTPWRKEIVVPRSRCRNLLGVIMWALRRPPEWEHSGLY